MNINLNTSVETKTVSQNNRTANTDKTKNEGNVTLKDDVSVVYEKGNEEKNYKPDTDTIKKLKEEVDQKTKALRDLVEKLFAKQGKTFEISRNLSSKADWEYAILNGEIDQETIDKAKEDISENGYYGVKQTTERIVSFAKALSGGDPSKIEILKDAVIKGFKQAEALWGDKLPEICQETYDAVMAEFDSWTAESK